MSLVDGSKVYVTFEGKGDDSVVVETFEKEDTHSVEMLKASWQAFMNNFKAYSKWAPSKELP